MARLRLLRWDDIPLPNAGTEAEWTRYESATSFVSQVVCWLPNALRQRKSRVLHVSGLRFAPTQYSAVRLKLKSAAGEAASTSKTERSSIEGQSSSLIPTRDEYRRHLQCVIRKHGAELRSVEEESPVHF